MMDAPLRMVFMGSDAIARPLLDWLTDPVAPRVRIVAVYTQPDRPVGRGQKIAPNPIKLWAQEKGLPVRQPEKLTDAERSELAAFDADFALVMAYGHILRDAFIGTPRLGTLNLHASILPKYRGASPIQSAIAAGERETGVSLMRIVRELDAGPVADVERVAIAARDTGVEVEASLAQACIPLMARALPALAAGTLDFREQDAAAATYCRRLTKEDGGLDFGLPASELAARINGLYPWPAARVEISRQSIKLGGADRVPGSALPGEVVGQDAEGLLVGTSQDLLRLLKLQRPGGRMMPAAEFLRGLPVGPGTRLLSRPSPALIAPRPFR